MGRKKVNLQRITDDTTRRVVFNKRSQLMMKKTSELVKLCGIKACCVIYDENGEHPQVWPSVAEARAMMKSYKDMPDVPQWKKKTSQEEYLVKCIDKVRKQVERTEEATKACEAQILFHDAVAGRRPGLIGVTSDQLARLSKLVEEKKKKLLERMRQLGIEPPEQPQPQQQQQPAYAFSQMHIQASVQEPQHQMLTVPSPATSLGYGAFFAGSSSGAGPSTGNTSLGSFAGNISGAGPSTGNTSLGSYGAFAGNSPSTGNSNLGCSGIFAGNSTGAGPSTGNTSLGCSGVFAGNSTGTTSLGCSGIFADNGSGAGPSTGNTSLGCYGIFADNSSGAGPSTTGISHGGGDILQPPINQGVWPWNSFFTSTLE